MLYSLTSYAEVGDRYNCLRADSSNNVSIYKNSSTSKLRIEPLGELQDLLEITILGENKAKLEDMHGNRITNLKKDYRNNYYGYKIYDRQLSEDLTLKSIGEGNWIFRVVSVRTNFFAYLDVSFRTWNCVLLK